MSASHTGNHLKGLVITAIGGLALSVDIPLIRLAAGDDWTVLALRSAGTVAAAFVAWALWRRLNPPAPRLVPGRTGLVVATFYGLTSITFVLAVYNTSTANVAFILAFNPMFAALLSWLFLGERPQPATLAAMAAMIAGVFVIVSDSIGTGQLFGDAMALASAFLIARAIVVSRSSGRNMGFTPLVGAVLPLLVAAYMVSKGGLRIDAPWWIALDGAVMTPVAFFRLATGPRYLSGPEVSMFYLLETVLAPIWVWLVFAEEPSRNSLTGGAILIAALVAHSAWQLTATRRRATEAIRHPL